MQFEVWLFGIVHFFYEEQIAVQIAVNERNDLQQPAAVQASMQCFRFCSTICIMCCTLVARFLIFSPRFCKHLNMPTYFVLLLPVQTWKRRLLLTNLSKTCYFFVRLYVCGVLPMSNGALFSALQMLFCIVHCSLYKRMMSLFLQHAFCSPIEHVFTHSSYPPALSVLLFT